MTDSNLLVTAVIALAAYGAFDLLRRAVKFVGGRRRARTHASPASDMDPPTHYWFPAKRYGWGWGLPSAWQGWVVFAVYLAVIAAVCIACPPNSGAVRFAALIVLATALLTLVCWITGEPPRWSWGDKHDASQEASRRTGRS